VTTANELVIPLSDRNAGRPIYLQLESADVIHSFWIPRLAGKTDFVPGRTNEMWIQADEAGTFLGRCAEFCGTQHAKMLIRVDAVSPEAFTDWVAQQQRPANPVANGSPGHRRFMTLACANCHTIRGTEAVRRFGPDLTHLMSRTTLASGIMENNRENLTRWIADPNQDKDGCRMPDMRLSPSDVNQIVDYLVTLE
jgi:cytochrome c oxidase subunit 2